MASCWTKIAQLGLGLFSRERDAFVLCPLSIEEWERQCTPQIKPHAIWINFLAERMSLARYCTQAHLDLLEMMFLQTLSLNIGEKRQDRQFRNFPEENDSRGLFGLRNFIPFLKAIIHLYF